jgi:hypothetical protein
MNLWIRICIGSGLNQSGSTNLHKTAHIEHRKAFGSATRALLEKNKRDAGLKHKIPSST